MNLAEVTITTERLKLVPISRKYVDAIFKEFTPEVTTYMFPKPAESVNDTLEFIELSEKQRETGEAFNVSILDAQTGELLGGGGITRMNTKTPEFGIWIKKGAHGHKYGREAVKGLRDWAEKHLTYDHFVYPVDKRNIASRKIAESLGGVVKAFFIVRSEVSPIIFTFLPSGIAFPNKPIGEMNPGSLPSIRISSSVAGRKVYTFAT